MGQPPFQAPQSKPLDNMSLGSLGFGNQQGLSNSSNNRNNPSNSWGLGGGEQGWNNGGLGLSLGGQAKAEDPFSRGMGGLMMNTQTAPSNDFDLLASQYAPSNQMGVNSSMGGGRQGGPTGMDMGFDLTGGFGSFGSGNKQPIFNNPNLQFKNQPNNKKPNNLDFDLL